MAAAGFGLIDRLAFLYLATPVALFLVLWCKPLFGVPLGLAAVSATPALCRGPWQAPRSARVVLAGLAIAFGWTLLGGTGHFVYTNAFDWVVHDAVLRDLATHPDPVTYAAPGGGTLILRAPIAYYMVPALVGRLAGVRFADIAEFLWTFIGVGLFLLQILAGARRLKTVLIIGLTVVVFGGLGILVQPRSILDFGGDKVWWAHYYQYSPATVLLFWVPHHALPGWLSTAMIYRARDDQRFVGVAALLGALTLLWAPLVSIGLLPFFALLAWRRVRRREIGWLLTPYNLVAAPMIVLAAFVYLTAAAQTITSAIPVGPPDLRTSVLTYVSFVTLEFVILAGALWVRHRQAIDLPFFALSLAVLFLLPFFHFGPMNDLVMRGSIPALAILMFSLVDAWARPSTIDHRAGLIPILICAAAVTPLSEIARALLWARWPANLQRSIYDVAGGHSPNYLLRLSVGSPLGRLLREPSPRPLCAETPRQQIVYGVAASRGRAGETRLQIENHLDRDVLVKLRAPSQRTVFAALAPAGRSLTVSGAPKGEWEVDYASGTRWSDACQMFLADLAARRLSRRFVVIDGATLAISASPPARSDAESLKAENFIYN